MDNTPNMHAIQAIVLAAGMSSRFKTGRTKLLESICGKPMIFYPLDLLKSLSIPTTVVLGHHKDEIYTSVSKHFDHITFAAQENLLGTGHALAATKNFWTAETIMVINGDMPLLKDDVIKKLYKKHINSGAAITFATAHHCDPNAMYARVIKANEDIQVIEAQDYEGEDTENCCISAGVFLLKKDFLKYSIDMLVEKNHHKEWYISDLINHAYAQKYTVETVSVPFDSIRGVNDFKELWAAEQIKKSEIINHWMEQGVRFSIAHNVQIDWNVTIGAGSFIGSGAQLLQGTTVGENCVIGTSTFLRNAHIENNTTIHAYSVVDDARIGQNSFVGPFSLVHGNSIISHNVKVGSFVEINRSIIGEYTTAKHLSYLGDAYVGSNVTIGAGLITCNFDGVQKHKTTIKDQAFIGGNNTLVPPLVIGQGAITAAGSTITLDVPDNSLGIARERQINKIGYAEKVHHKTKDGKSHNFDDVFFSASEVNNSFEHIP